jgi:hypothetical protein
MFDFAQAFFPLRRARNRAMQVGQDSEGQQAPKRCDASCLPDCKRVPHHF